MRPVPVPWVLRISRQVPVEDSTEHVLLVFYQAESRGKRVNSTYNSMLMQSHCQCTLPVRTAKFTCNSMLMQSHCQFTIPVRTATVRWVTKVQLASLPAFVKDLGIWRQSALTCQVVTLTHEIALTVLASHVRERSKHYLWQGNAQITAGEFPNNPRTSPFKLQMSW